MTKILNFLDFQELALIEQAFDKEMARAEVLAEIRLKADKSNQIENPSFSVKDFERLMGI